MTEENSQFKVCILAPVHIWDDVRVYHKEAVSLAQSGYEVSLIARTEKVKSKKGVTLIPAKTNKESRILRFFLLPMVFIQALNQRADVYHLHNPDTLPIGFFLKLFGKKVIYDTHEDFTKRIQAKYWLPKVLRNPFAKLIGSAESIFCRFFDGAIATQKEVVSRLGPKAVLIQNPPRTNVSLIEKVKMLKKEITDSFSGFRVIYIGTITESRGLFTMVNAMEHLNKEIDVRLWLIGKVREESLKKAQWSEGWKYVDYIAPLPQEEAFAYVAKSDLGLIVLNPSGGHQNIDPNKIWEYMTFGVPFIASDFRKWVKRIGENHAGWFVKPDDPKLLSKKIVEALSDKERLEKYKVNALQFIKTYNWENESAKLLQLYEKVRPNK